MSDESLDRHSDEVQQAAGMVSVQTNCLIEQALVLMEARAELDEVTLDEVAAAVIYGSIRFD